MTRSAPNRPPGWVPPGPSPRPPAGPPDLSPGDDETLSYLTGDFRIFQKKDGHRWSLDDFVTAYIAIERTPRTNSPRVYDLGCGIGSVLMMMAWAFPTASVHGVEAQAISHALALRSIRYNGIDDRCSVTLGDLRHVPLNPTFDLVTGTPPYIPLGSGFVSENAQRGPCLNETRGGIEDYALTASRLLSPTGQFVACVGPWPPDRGTRAATHAGLHLAHTVQVVPREGKPVLFRVLVMQRPALAQPTEGTFTVRDRGGALTEDMHRAREVMGQPPKR